MFMAKTAALAMVAAIGVAGVALWARPLPMAAAKNPVAVVTVNKDANNPIYVACAAGAGKELAFSRRESMSGGAPMPGGRQPTVTAETWTVSEVTADHATITIATGDQKRTLSVPANIAAGDGAAPQAGGTEDIKVGDKTYACKVYHYTTKSADELGRNAQGMAGRVTVWVCPDAPGGIVQRQVSLTIRVSYDTVETLQPAAAKGP